MTDPATKRAIQEAIRKAFEEEEQKRDAEFEAQAKRLLDHIDRFERGAGDGPPS
jgi:molecular chaperone GrpE (heat shock protein)